jgi:hypothetical protein
MNPQLVTSNIDWNLIWGQLNQKQDLPNYPGDLKAALLQHAGLAHHPQGEAVYQLAVEISRLSTCCDPEIIYWFSRLVTLLEGTPLEQREVSVQA